MKIKELKTTQAKLMELELNKGQIEGLPKNPRFIRDERFEDLKRSIAADPEMLELRELVVYPLESGKFCVIMGNMRLRALRELAKTDDAFKMAPIKILPKDTPAQKLRAYTIKDNISFGRDDFDALANEWELEELLDFGLECEFLGATEDVKEEGEGKAATELGEPREETTLKIKLTSSEQYAAVVDALLAFDGDLSVAIVKALGLEAQ